MSQLHKIFIGKGERMKQLREAYKSALDLEDYLNRLGEPLLATKARKLVKILWYNIERQYRDI